jgi:MSHA pilin protein MshC
MMNSRATITERRLEPKLPAQSGFTMIELVTVMLVVGILAVVVLPRFDLLKGFDEIGYRDKVKATLEYARKSAVAQRRYVCAVIDASNDVTLTIESVNPENVSHTLACPYTRPLGLPAADKECGAGVTNRICNPGSITLTPAATLQFDPLGRAVQGAGDYTVSGGGTIAVVAETGYVH